MRWATSMRVSGSKTRHKDTVSIKHMREADTKATGSMTIKMEKEQRNGQTEVFTMEIIKMG